MAYTNNSAIPTYEDVIELLRSYTEGGYKRMRHVRYKLHANASQAVLDFDNYTKSEEGRDVEPTEEPEL